MALIEPMIPPAKRGGNKRKVDMREIVNGIMYILATGCQWRALPKDLDGQLVRLTAEGCTIIRSEKVSGATAAGKQ